MHNFIKSYKNTLQNKQYNLLLSANTISRFGDSIHEIALVFIVFNITNNPILMSSISIVSLIPNLLFGPLAGTYVDKRNKLNTMIYTDIARGLFTLLIPLAIYLKSFEIMVIFIVAFINSIFETLNLPAQQSILPILVEEDNLQSSNALIDLFSRIGNILGNCLASFFIGGMLVLEAFFCDSITFFLSAILIIILKKQIKLKNQSYNFVFNNKKETIWESLKNGLNEIKKNKIIKSILVVSLFLNIGGAPLMILMPFYLSNALHIDTKYLGIIIAIMTAGIMIGSFLFGGLKISKGKGFLVGSIGVGLMFIILSLFPFIKFSVEILKISIFFVFIFMIGLLISLANVFIPTIFQIYTPVELRGRIFAASRSILAIGQPLSLAFSGILINILGPVICFLLFGSLIFIISMSYLLFSKNLKKI
jgi:DHA3 family macrolide efflux protein-like MFS transporter